MCHVSCMCADGRMMVGKIPCSTLTCRITQGSMSYLKGASCNDLVVQKVCSWCRSCSVARINRHIRAHSAV